MRVNIGKLKTFSFNEFSPPQPGRIQRLNYDEFETEKMIQHRFLTRFVYLFAILLGGFTAAQAQQNNLSIMPATVEAKVKRGSTYTQTFTFSNNTPERLKLNNSLIDYWYDENNKRITARPGTLPRSASLWVQFSPAETIVEPHSTSTVKAIITIPLTASGSYYTMPVFEALPVKTEKTFPQAAETVSAASIGIRFRGVMVLTTEDAAEYSVEIKDGQISPPTASSELNVQLDLINRGNAHVRVRGAFAILNGAGVLAGRGKLEDKRYFPKQSNSFQGSWAGNLPPGNYTCIVTLSYDRAGLDAATLIQELRFTVK